MQVSVFDLFKPGIGPSSSHTMGPMTAANLFVDRIRDNGRLDVVARVAVKLFGSLALTGRGHATDRAVMLGLLGFVPATMDPDEGDAALAALMANGTMRLGGDGPEIVFDETRDIDWAMADRLPAHSNAVRFVAHDGDGQPILTRDYYSVGGGFVLDQDEIDGPACATADVALPYPFANADELLAIADREGLSIAELILANEQARRPLEEVCHGLDNIHAAMNQCIDRGLRTEGILPGGLEVKRRAPGIYQRYLDGTLNLTGAGGAGRQTSNDPLAAMDLVNLWALAVNEENAAGGRVVTAPTNGAAGLLPAVLRYYCHFYDPRPEEVHTFLLTAAAIGALFKTNASISGAEVGCQGEVGVACAMAAAGLCAVLDGTVAQVENAAEIGMEHNLGLTCDPIGGLVQIPCIERNAMGAIKAIDAARLALLGDGQHKVSLDTVIATMKRTGADMSEIYKETSLGGLAVSQVEC
jgi:L-serine dehydratase